MEQKINPKELYTVPQLAALLGCTRANVNAKVWRGSVTAKKVGTQWLITGAEVLRVVKESEIRKIQ
jgi:excisionase family DNA binding protein